MNERRVVRYNARQRMRISPGTQLGVYHITGLLGAGGMGEVYRAHDTKLGRDVAIKTIPEVFSKNPERLARFQREARALAVLNHPNIAAVHAFEERAGNHYLILELIEGQTLDQRITQGPIPLDEVLEIARQIALALEAAHEKAVIHRDLKPANIMITPSGQVKVLDFGLAKTEESAGQASAGMSHSPTLLSGAAEHPSIIGTAAYMSPEQAKGKVVDKRTDNWSFGCVLYEMLTGCQAFSGEEVTDVIARILQGEPDWSSLPANTPRTILNLLHRCLAKVPARRLRDIGDALIEIEYVQRGAEELPAAARKTSRAPWLVAALTTSVAVTILALMLIQNSAISPQQGGQPIRFSIQPPKALGCTNPQ